MPITFGLLVWFCNNEDNTTKSKSPSTFILFKIGLFDKCRFVHNLQQIVTVFFPLQKKKKIEECVFLHIHILCFFRDPGV